MELLNQLYTSCDAILDRYDCYKVETIGDSYMVVSGCPIRNGAAHSSEIATVALDILRMIDEFTIPHQRPKEPILMRIGIHTGNPASDFLIDQSWALRHGCQNMLTARLRLQETPVCPDLVRTARTFRWS